MGQASAMNNSYDVAESRTRNYTATIGLGWALSETWKVTADVGGRFSSADFDVVTLVPSGHQGTFIPLTTNESRDSAGWVANTAISVRGEVDNGRLAFSRNVGLASSRIGTSENTTVDVSYRRLLTDKFSASVSAGYQLSRSNAKDLSAGRIDEDYIRCNAGVRYEFDRNMMLDAGYSYLKALYNQSDTSAERNNFMVSFTIRHPLLDRW
jgi:long-subunit fatty acid transport protein